MKSSITTTVFLCLLLPMLLAQPLPKLTLEPYVFENRQQKQVEAEMGTLLVPENRQQADSQTLTLKFVRFKSTNPNPGSPIVYLAGGPGGSGIYTAQGSRFELFMAMREIADVIAFDQRGAGYSDQPLTYDEYWLYPFDQPLERERVGEIITNYTEKANDFWQENGVDLAAYNTNESADDLNDLRIALGAEKISLWGISYGTHLALATMKRHEQHLDKVILAGVEGLNHTVKLPSSSQNLLEKIDALIKADPQAREAFPDFLGDLDKLLNQVDQTPVMVATVHPLTKENLEVAIGKYDLQILLSFTLRGPDSFRQLPYMVKQMLAGDFSSLSDWVLATHAGNLYAMSTGMDVASGISAERQKQVAKESTETLLGDAINFPYAATYAALSHLDLGADFRAPVVADLPVLCISGTLDGRTPPDNAAEVLEHLPNGLHLIIEGAGHSDPLFLSSPQILESMLQFMRGEPIKEDRIVLPPVAFYLGSNK